MAAVTRNQLKQWFESRDKPTQAQFWALIDSFFHISEGISVGNISGLTEMLSSKVDVLTLSNYAQFKDVMRYAASVDVLPTLSRNDCAFVIVDSFAILRPVETSDLPNDDTTFYSSVAGWLWKVILQPFGDGNNNGGILADRFTFDSDYIYTLPAGNFADMICIKPTGIQTITITINGEEYFSGEIEGGIWMRLSVDAVADTEPLEVSITGATDQCNGIVYKRAINDL